MKKLVKDIAVGSTILTTTSIAMTALNIITITNPVLNIGTNLAMQYVNVKVLDKQSMKIVKDVKEIFNK